MIQPVGPPLADVASKASALLAHDLRPIVCVGETLEQREAERTLEVPHGGVMVHHTYLSGYAWGENVGWINFEPAYGGVFIDPATGEFSGYAWGENIGWLKFKGLSPAFNVRTLAFDKQSKGTPNWWLALYNITDQGVLLIALFNHMAVT